jgi:hypothetical protein
VHGDPDRNSRQLRLLTMTPRTRRDDSTGPSHEELVLHLVACMEREGLTVEAADAPGYGKPPQLKRGLRPGRGRPAVVARDGRRTILGEVKTAQEMGEGHVPEQLETFASKCRLLVVCVPEGVADEAVSLLNGADMPHRPKMRLLRYPRAKWDEFPKLAGPKKSRDLASLVRVVSA